MADERRFLVVRFPNVETRNMAALLIRREMPRVPFENLSPMADAMTQSMTPAAAANLLDPVVLKLTECPTPERECLDCSGCPPEDD